MNKKRFVKTFSPIFLKKVSKKDLKFLKNYAKLTVGSGIGNSTHRAYANPGRSMRCKNYGKQRKPLFWEE